MSENPELTQPPVNPASPAGFTEEISAKLADPHRPGKLVEVDREASAASLSKTHKESEPP